MDFHSLLNTAKQNVPTVVKKDKFYSTSFAPPKKTPKEKKLSAGIQKFLEDKKREDEAKAEEARRKKAALLASRDEKQQRKIEKTLKTIKSSRKFHSGDKILDENTAVTLENEQPDEDDYGYVSSFSEQLHKKLMQQYSSMPEDKKFASSMGKSRIKTKEDVQKLKDSLCTKEDEQHFKSGSTPRKSHAAKPSTSSGSSNLYQDSKPTNAADKPKPKHRQAPIVDFKALLKLAEQKQHEEIEIEVPLTKKKEDRPLTSKEKREQEEAEAYRRGRIERMKLAKKAAAAGGDKNNNSSNGAGMKTAIDKQRVKQHEQDERKLKLMEKLKVPVTSISRTTDKILKPSTSSSKLADSRSPPTQMNSSKRIQENVSSSKLKTALTSSKPRDVGKQQNGHSSSSQKASTSAFKSTTANSKVPEKTREFPPKDLQTKSRDFPPKDLMRAREFPPKDLMRAREFPPKDLLRSREFPPRDLKPLKHQRGKPSINLKKRRIEDEDSDEYDSEMDDFIDDGDAEVDYSAEIRNIFGYDKSRYRNEVYDDDDMMESNFQTVMREEAISKKIGRMEDLEDIRREEEELKLKAQMRKNKKKMKKF